jgi:carbonic anhydrase/acetyltransferase-like protein (isoleucine patch superfamily)
MAHLFPFDDKQPQIAPDAFIAPTAVLIGDVVVEEGASVWFGVVLRGDFNRIVVGAGSSIQDNSVLHTAVDVPTTIGPNVTIGHLCMLEACTVGDGALIGMGSIVLNRARVGERAMLAAGSVVREDGEIPPEVLAAGVPAQVKKGLTEVSFGRMEEAAHEYQALRLRYMHRAGQLTGDFREGEA